MNHKKEMGVAILVGLFSFVAGCAARSKTSQTPPVQPPSIKPVLTVRAPTKFEMNPYSSRVLVFTVDVEDVDHFSDDPIQLKLKNSAGQAVDVEFTNALTVFLAATGHGTAGIDLVATPVPNGRYQVCARLKAAEECTPTEIIKAEPTDCEKAFEAAKGKMGCRCTSAKVKILKTESPDGTLGKFIPGGNVMGVFDTNDNVKTKDKFSSLAKFEPHFTVAIIDDPGVPEKCTKEEWQRLSLSVCSEGQEINFTATETVGGITKTKSYKVGDTEYPFDKRKEAKFAKDGWGYGHPAKSGDEARIEGAIKTHDAPDIIHWLDDPGGFKVSSSGWKDKLPAFDENYFHTFVHGTTGKPADNCDCYHYVKDKALNADGSVAPVIEAASCSP